MIYLDSAATSLIRPREAERAAISAFSCGNPGRGGHRAAMEAAMKLYAVRETAARHFASDLPEGVCFFENATTALNAVVRSLTAEGGTLLLSDMEHNALRRPALSLSKKGVRVDFFKGYGTKREIIESFSGKLRPKPALAAFIHCSNVCPQTLPVAELCSLAEKRGVLTLVDCAQSGGHMPLDMAALHADALVLPSHKGLMGIMGAGMLVCSKRMKTALENAPTVMEGGSGVHSFEEGMPGMLPERLEWGTPPLPAILSVGAGLRFIEEYGYAQIEEKLSRLARRTAEGIGSIPGLKLRGINKEPGSAGPLLFIFDACDQSALARTLYDEGICLREGFHCAPLAHKSIGTEKTGGLRVSFSIFNRMSEIDRFLKILDRSVRSLR